MEKWLRAGSGVIEVETPRPAGARLKRLAKGGPARACVRARTRVRARACVRAARLPCRPRETLTCCCPSATNERKIAETATFCPESTRFRQSFRGICWPSPFCLVKTGSESPQNWPKLGRGDLLIWRGLRPSPVIFAGFCSPVIFAGMARHPSQTCLSLSPGGRDLPRCYVSRLP